MCRNIKTLYNFEPPATDDEIHAAAVQYVRKVSGTTGKRPAQVNQEAFDEAVIRVAAATADLLGQMVSHAPPKNREEYAAKRRALNAKRFGRA